MKIPMTQQPIPGPAFDSAMLNAVLQIGAMYQQLRDNPAFAGTMVAAAALCGGGIGALVANEMTDDEITAFILKVIAQARSAMASLQASVATNVPAN